MTMKAKQLITDNLLLVLGLMGIKAASARQLAGSGEPRDVEPAVQISEKSGNGDYYTNLPLKLSSILKKKPLDIAYEIKKELEKSIKSTKSIRGTKGEELGSIIAKIDVVAPGFVNFFMSEQYLFKTIGYVNKKGVEFGNSESLKDQKTMVEFTDPNPFKEFHIGHLYSNIVGESLSRLFESQGANVMRVCYQGDVGQHVAKAIYGMQKLKNEMPEDSAPLSIRAQFMGKAYTYGATEFEKNDKTKQEINELNKKIYDLPAGRQVQDDSVREFYNKGKEWSLEYFNSLYKRLGTKFEHHYFESEVGKIGVELVREFLKKGVFEESDGAIIFPGEKYGLHNRVFINSLGLPTYEAKDMGLAGEKNKDFPYDRSIIITAQEQAEYFKVVLKALEQIRPELAKKTTHISHGMVRLPSGKMSSRTGEVITGEWLMDEAVARIQKEYPEMDSETSEKVGLAAVKFALLKASIGRDIEFNFDESIALSGASGPYLQYTYVRTKSVLDKYKVSSIKYKVSNTENRLNSEEKEVLRQLVYFPETLQMAAEKMSPNLVAEYLFELSQKFNLFYQKHKISENEFRLKLTESVGIVLKNGLHLLGIEQVEKM